MSGSAALTANDTVLVPGSEEEAAQLIAAADPKQPFSIRGGGTKASVGGVSQASVTLSSKDLSRVNIYEPAELAIAVQAGIPQSRLEALLDQKGQRLAFEPMDWRPLLGTSGEPTAGGMVASNSSGPRRISVGACRDSLIGVRFVNGNGEVIKSGGRVMKNVTGLDLNKLMAGAWGTLGFLTEVTFKVLPQPETTITLALRGLGDEQGVAALCAAMASPFFATGAAHLPRTVGSEALTLIRVEGFAAAAKHRAAELERLLKPFAKAEPREDGGSLWAAIRDVAFLAEPRDAVVWRVSVAPKQGPSLTAELAKTLAARWFYDWSGGLVWIAVNGSPDGGAAVIRKALATIGGHATLIRAPAELRARTAVFQPLSEPLMRISRGIKAAFDPRGILEPGRIYSGS